MANELAAQAEAEQAIRLQRELLGSRIEEDRLRLGRLESVRDRATELPGRQRRTKESEIDAEERELRGRIAESESELRELPATPPAQDQAHAIEAITKERVQMAVTAARLRTPSYVREELGERPAGRHEAKAWDRAVTAVERYRRDNGVTDADRALGQKPQRESGAEHARRQMAERQLREGRRRPGRETARGRSIGIERSIGR